MLAPLPREHFPAKQTVVNFQCTTAAVLVGCAKRYQYSSALQWLLAVPGLLFLVARYPPHLSIDPVFSFFAFPVAHSWLLVLRGGKATLVGSSEFRDPGIQPSPSTLPHLPFLPSFLPPPQARRPIVSYGDTLPRPYPCEQPFISQMCQKGEKSKVQSSMGLVLGAKSPRLPMVSIYRGHLPRRASSRDRNLSAGCLLHLP